MSENRLSDYLNHIQQASVNACFFVEGLNKEEFDSDKRTQLNSGKTNSEYRASCF